MLKVICIDASRGKKFGCIPTFKAGDKLIVTEINQDNSGNNYFLIKDHERCKGDTTRTFWHEERFIRTSDICETELAKQREEYEPV